MTQFLDRNYFGYNVSLRPNDWLRSRLRFPPLNLDYVPYFTGSDISVILYIKRTKSASPDVLTYEWKLFKKNSVQPDATGTKKVDLKRDTEYKAVLFLKHFSYTDEYRVDFAVTTSDKHESSTVADFEITSRATFQFRLLWFLLGALFTILGVIIGYFMGQ